MHIPVLLHECLEGLQLTAGMTVIDGTINGGGHSEAIAKKYGDTVHIVGIDLDADALERSEKKLKALGAKFTLVCDSYINIQKIVAEKKLQNIGGVLFDFGLSSDQFESSGRGFSFQKDEPLLMTFARETDGVTAQDIVNKWEESSLTAIIKGFGEERHAYRIAKAIVDYRAEADIKTTGQLVEIIEQAVGKSYRKYRIHPATRTFQALRIAVNGELTSIPEGLKGAREVLAEGGRLCAISFHSLEDRIVKHFCKAQKEVGDTIITKKPLVASDSEISANPRSRSAKLRILEKHTS